MKPTELDEIATRLAKNYGIRLSQSPEFNKYPSWYQKKIRQAVYDKLQPNTSIK